MMFSSTTAASNSSTGGMSTLTFGHPLPSSAGALGFSSFNTLGPSSSNLVNGIFFHAFKELKEFIQDFISLVITYLMCDVKLQCSACLSCKRCFDE
ncbi:hypothetical protein HanOQP8_Chr06g0228011 [Helianthus annuus]|nr:hypothetical protein HanOQP8_Chr06g0228011 [Helianthus annuus]